MFYIYSYIDPRNNKPFYIGKGTHNRLYSHLKETVETTINKRKFYKIQKIKSLGLEPTIEIIEDGIEDEIDAYNREDFYILKYGRERYDKDGILTNIIINNIPPNCSGELNGMYGKEHTEESKKLMSDNRKGLTVGEKNGMYGKEHTEESKKLMSDNAKGRTAWNKGQSRTIEDKQKMKHGWAKRREAGIVTKKKECPHCGRFLDPGNYAKSHGDKCKEKK